MSKIYSMVEIPDLQIDACIKDDNHNLVFLSVWGRDTSIQEFLGRAILNGKSKEYGLELFHVQLDYREIPVYIGDVKRLEKVKQKVSDRSLFGQLTHMWVYDSKCVKADKATHKATLLTLDESDEHHTTQLWQVVKDLCPLPLLDHWELEILALIEQYQMIKPLNKVVGTAKAWNIDLDLPRLQCNISDMIKADLLTTEPSAGYLALRGDLSCRQV